jgi:hypothetical protein
MMKEKGRGRWEKVPHPDDHAGEFLSRRQGPRMKNDPREVLGRQNWWRFVREMGIRFTYGDDDDGIFRVVVYALGRRGEREERRGERDEREAAIAS